MANGDEPKLDMEVLAKLENQIEDLKRAYEFYFMGMERIPPEREFVRIQGVVRKLRNVYNPNTAVKFRLESLVAKFQSYSRLWMRTMKEIEDGRYVRDQFKANIRVGKVAPAAGAQKSAGDSKFDENMDKLYKEYMMARIECNQGTDGLSKDKIKSSIQKTLPKIKQKYKGKDIQFKVVIEGGKAKLKAIPK